MVFPRATRKGELFEIAGRVGLWKFVDGRRRPRDIMSKPNHIIAEVRDKRGRKLIREFVRIREYAKGGDCLFLERLRSRTLRVDFETGEVWSCLTQNGPTDKWKKLATFPGESGRLFVRCYLNGKRKAISVGRLVLMADIDDVLPEGWDADHWDRDVTNNALTNLRPRNGRTNQSDNGSFDVGF